LSQVKFGHIYYQAGKTMHRILKLDEVPAV
jgi:hypothetical protein